jgi:hypothetical protein
LLASAYPGPLIENRSVDFAQIFPQVLDLKFSLQTAVEVQRKFQFPNRVPHVAIAGFGFCALFLAPQHAVFARAEASSESRPVRI